MQLPRDVFVALFSDLSTRQLFRRFLSFMLSWCLVFVPLFHYMAPAAHARIPDDPSASSFASVEDEEFNVFGEEGLDLALEHRHLWRQMKAFQRSIYGSADEWQQAQAWIEENDFLNAGFFQGIGVWWDNLSLFHSSDHFNFDTQAENFQDWSLFTFLRVHYKRADQLKDENYLIAYDHPEIQGVFQRALALKSQVERAIRDTHSTRAEKESLILAYSALVNFSSEDVLTLFSHEGRSESQRAEMKWELRLHFDSSYQFEKWQEGLLENGVIISDHPIHSFKSYLEIDTIAKLDRKLSILASFPFQPFYTRMIRLMTLSDMMSRLSMYKQILKDPKSIEMPASCQNDRNFSFPEELQFDMMTDPERQQLMDGLLSRNGLLTTTYEGELNHLNDYIEDYILNYSSASLDSGGFHEKRPFERYLSAHYATNNPVIPYTDDIFYDPMSLHSAPLQAPMIDHSQDLPIVLGGKVAQFLRKEVKKHRLSFIDLAGDAEIPLPAPGQAPYSYLAQQNMAILENAKESREVFQEELTSLVQKMLTIAPDGRNDSGHMINEYLLEKLEQEGLDPWSWESLLTQEQVKNLEENVVRVQQMPPLRAPESWRRWAFEKIYDLSDKMLSENAEWSEQEQFYVRAAFVQSCQHQPLLYICQGTQSQDLGMIVHSSDRDKINEVSDLILKRVKEVLQDYAYRGDYHPLVETSVYANNRWQESYSYFQSLWLRIKDFEEHHDVSYLEGSDVSEIDYLYTVAENDLAAHLRLSYLVYKQMDVEQVMPQTQKSIERFFEMLKVDRPLHPYWANEVLSKKEQEFMWAEVKRQENQNSSYLFNRSLTRDPEQEFYHLFSWLQVTPLFDDQKLNQAIYEVSQNLPTDELRSEIQHRRQILGESNLLAFKEIYNHPEKIEENIDLIKSIQEQEGLHTDSALKSYIHQWDINMRAPVYYHALKEAAYLRKSDIHQQLETLCSLDEFGDSKFMDMRRLHSSTISMQRKAMELFKATLPKTVEKSTTRWVKDDRDAFYWGIGAGLMVVAAAITTTVLGAPIAGLALGVGSLGMNAVSITADLRQFIDSKEYITNSDVLEELGYTSAQDAKRNFMKTPGIAIMGILFTLPDIGIMRVSVSMISKLNLESYLKSFIHKGAKASRKSLTRYTAKILSLEDVAQNILETSGRVSLRHGRRKSLRELAQRFSSKAIARGTIDESVGVLDGHAARVISDLYNNNLNRFANSFLTPYGNRLSKRIYKKSFQKTQRKYQKVLQGLAELQGDNAFNRYRLGRLQTKKFALEAKKIQLEERLEVTRRLKNLSENLFQASAVGMSLDTFLQENMDDLGRAIPYIRPKLKDIPSYIFQGLTPNRHGRTPVMGALTSRFPSLAAFSDYDLVKKLFLARNQLIAKEAMERAARELGVERTMAHNSYYTVKKAYSNMRELAESLIERSPDQALELFEQAYKTEGEILETMKRNLQRRGSWSKIAHKYNHWSTDSLREVFRKGDDMDFVALFNSIDPEKIFGLEVIPQSAHDTALRLAGQMEALKTSDPKKAVNQLFSRYIKALEVLSINKNFQLMEHMF